MHTITSLESLTFDQLARAFGEAFGSYEIQINKEELGIMLERRGFNPALSFGAFDNHKLVGFTFNGIGDFNGTKTAYDTGTGTLKEYQGKGIATEIFNYSIPFLKKADIQQYLLEVLQHNTKAVSVYTKLGFEVTRTFNYFRQNKADINFSTKKLPENYSIKNIHLTDKAYLQSFWDFEPSWQNSFDAVERRLQDFIIKGIFKDDVLTGYIIFDPHTGDVTQLAVNRLYRNNGIGSMLFRETLKANAVDLVKIINTSPTCYELTSFLAAHNIMLSGKQFEMIKKL